MGTDFYSFLNKMDNETNDGKKKTVKPEIKEHKEPPKKKPEPQNIQEEVKLQTQSKEDLREEYVEKGLNYATVFIKSIRKNFKDKEERQIVLESVRTAINLYLGENIKPTYQPPIQERVQTSITPVTISEKDWERLSGEELQGNIPSGVTSNPTLPIKSMTTQKPLNEGYNRKLNIDCKLGPNGKPEVDLSTMTDKDVYDIKVLAGLIK